MTGQPVYFSARQMKNISTLQTMNMNASITG